MVIRMRLRYRIPLAVIAVMLVITMFLGSSYALWKVTKYQETTNIIETGCFELSFTEQSSSISLKNTYPITDEKGLKTTPYMFTLKNTCTIAADYKVYLNTLETTGTKITDSLIKYSLQKTGDSVAVASLLGAATVNSDVTNFTYDKNLLTSYELATGTLQPEDSVQYSLRLWIDESATTAINGQTFEAGIATVAYVSETETVE